MLNCAEVLPRTSNTHLPTDEATGECPLPDRARARIGRCGWKDRTALNGPILWRALRDSINLRQFADPFSIAEGVLCCASLWQQEFESTRIECRSALVFFCYCRCLIHASNVSVIHKLVEWRGVKQLPTTTWVGQREKRNLRVAKYSICSIGETLMASIQVYGAPTFLGPVPHQFWGPRQSPANPTFGTPNYVVPARQVQLALRWNF